MTDAQALRCERIAADLADLSLEELAAAARGLASWYGALYCSISIGHAPIEIVESTAAPGIAETRQFDDNHWTQTRATNFAGDVSGEAVISTAHTPVGAEVA